MAENGTKTITFVGGIIGGVLSIIVIIYTIVYAPLNKAVAEERDKRETTDITIQQTIKETIDYQQENNQKTAVVLERILTKLEAIEKKV